MTQFEEVYRLKKAVDPCILVIFGATGDLTARKLFPALYNLALDNQLPNDFVCVGFARREKTDDAFRKEMLDAVNEFSRNRPVDPVIWDSFQKKIFYHQSEFHDDAGYESLSELLQRLDHQFGTGGNRLFYLSTQPSFFPLVVEKLNQHHLLYDVNKTKDRWSRIIIEKPFGHDLPSALQLQSDLSRHLDESQIYRIDHYLGKETVQNLLILRFSNSIFEALWNNHHIDHVHISVSEEMGIGTRGHFWEEAGMIRDIVQNHMMQLLCLVAMEPPINLKADAIHNEKVKIMLSLRPIPIDELKEYAIRGQYGPGEINGEKIRGYRQEGNVDPHSNVETYAALKLYIDNWRWSGVPFYLTAGKRLAKRATEITIVFKDAPGYLFQHRGSKNNPNILVIRIQPNEGISLNMNCKVPGLSNTILPVKMDFLYGSYFGATAPEAYERLICDCIAGDNTLFARADEVMAAWRLLTPILKKWATEQPDFPNYAPGSFGPNSINDLMDKKKYDHSV